MPPSTAPSSAKRLIKRGSYVTPYVCGLQDAGAPVAETNLLGNFIYELGVARQDFGAASAVSLFVLALTVVLSWPYVRSLLKEDAA